MRRVGNDDDVALRLTLLLEVGLGDQQRGELGVRAGGRVQRERRHSEQRSQRAFELPHHCKRSLREAIGRERMQIAQRRNVGHGVVDPRIVLHRARAERIERGVDAECLLREPGEVTDDVQLRVVGQRQLVAQRVCRQQRLERGSGGQVAVGATLLPGVEDQRRFSGVRRQPRPPTRLRPDDRRRRSR